MQQAMLKNTVIFIFVVLLLGIIAIKSFFLFNPLTFTKDHVTYLPWWWYRGGLQIEYYDQVTNTTETSDDQKEIKRFIVVLKKGTRVPQLVISSLEPQIVLNIRTVTLRRKSDQVNLMVLHIDSKNHFAELKTDFGNVYVELIPDLDQLLTTHGFTAESVSTQ